MRKIELLFFVLLIIIPSAGFIVNSAEIPRFQPKLMPAPAQASYEPGGLRVKADFKVAIQGETGTRLCSAVTRMLHRLAGETGFSFSQNYITTAANGDDASLVISCGRIGELRLNEDETYTLQVTSEKAVLNASTDLGILHGLETFLQLLETDKDGYYIPGVSINDKPRFPWRGLLIDVSRHFHPVEVIKRNLDGMAVVKLNVFHWHLSDDQGFRIECKAFPRLHQMGSFGLYYTQAQIKEVIDYAADRGIRVIPEFDIPGHSTSWLVGYPELASLPGPYQIERNFGIFDPTFNPVREETYRFFDAFFSEMAALFPDEYIHIGGDENNGRQWDANNTIQEFMKKKNISDNNALQSYFNNRILSILTKYGKKMIGWDEIFQPQMPTDIVTGFWRGKEMMINAASQGYQGILVNGYYINLVQPLEGHYLNDPLPDDTPLTDEQKKNILGGEGLVWSELVNSETIDSRTWPRMAAIAERLWSPATVKDMDDMYRRMYLISARLEEVGLMHEKNYGMMLRRLARGDDIEALKNLTDVLEPVDYYSREQQRHYDCDAPLTRVVDAARPDPKVVWDFNKLVDGFLTDKKLSSSKMAEIKQWLVLWKNNHAKLQPMINHSPILKEIETLSKDLSSVAAAGLEALDYLSAKKRPSAKWLEDKETIIERAKWTRAQVELRIIPAISKLVEAAAKGK